LSFNFGFNVKPKKPKTANAGKAKKKAARKGGRQFGS
jgi:hypothetical protein